MSENQNSSREQGMEKYFFRASAADFKKIPGSPISYWAPDSVIRAFEHGSFLSDLVHARIALATGDNGQFIRCWSEVSFEKIGIGIQSNSESVESGLKWFPCNKGGDYRKWYGNNDFIVNWFNDGEAVKSLSDPETGRIRSHNYNGDFGFQESLSWSALSSSKLGIRHSPPGFLFVTPGSSAFRKSEKTDLHIVLSLLSSKVADYFLRLISATMNIEVGNVLRIPILEFEKEAHHVAKNAIALVKDDWDAYQTSWDFTCLPLLHPNHRRSTLKVSYKTLRAHWREMTLDMQRLEQENNRIFIDAYGLQDELTPEVPLNEITLTCNPHYRYGGDKSEEELEAMLLADTMRELVSYAIGCMMGRYSLDEPGLIYAHAGNIGFNATRYQAFPADADGIVPITDEFWFEDDAANRVREFLLTVWSADSLYENSAWLAESLGAKANETPGETIRRYLSSSFFKDHLQTYKKRPIYWLFSSGKQKAFEALVYLHRYNEGTLARMRAEYVVPLTGKMAERIKLLEDDALKASTPAARKKIDKDIDKLKRKLDELRTYDEKLRHYADMRISLDLDDGVKVNYGKFGDLLAEVKAVTGGSGDD